MAALGLPNRMLDDIKRDALAGIAVARPWELLRLAVYPGLDHGTAAAEIAKRADANGIKIDFDIRQVGDGKQVHDVIYVLFTAR
jgi:hypothetical protein